jgi:hypothetical protein
MSRVCYAKDEQSMNTSIGRKGVVVVFHVSRVNNYFELRPLTAYCSPTKLYVNMESHGGMKISGKPD